MPRNIEIKARIDSSDAIAAKARVLANADPVEISQDDTFFRCSSGRLKLREFADGSAELIYYRRPELSGPKESFYVRSPTAAPDSLRESLSLAYGQTGRVRKLRTLFMVGRTRVHLDRVEGLGDFLELEVVLADHETAATGISEANDLLRNLGIQRSRLIEGAYIDLLAALAPLPEPAAQSIDCDP